MKTALRRGVVAAAAAAVAAMSTAFFSSAQAATATVDQQQLTFTGTQSSVAVMAQTFTAGTTAQLVRVSIPFYSGFASVTIGVQSTSGAHPSGTYLSKQSWSSAQSCCRQFHDFDLATPVAVTQGTQYAIVVHRLAGSFNWYFSGYTPPSFTGGKLFLASSDTPGSTWYSGASYGADFGFKTWVSTSVNQAPVVAADNATVTVGEGTAPGNTGTFSDPDGDTVALTASLGTVTKTGTSSGTWTWTAPVSDEMSTQTVTVTADDGQGLTAATSFSLDVMGVAPVAQILTDPVSAPEGTAIPFTGAATSPDTADNAAGFAYSWSVTKNGSPLTHGSGSAFSFTPDDEGTYVVTFLATDDGGMTGTSSTTVVGANVAPTAAITGVSASAPLVVTPLETLTFGGHFADPGALDTHTVTWNFGDGAASTSSYGAGGSAGFSASHSYSSPGTYTVVLTVTDDDGGVGRATTQVTVQTAAQALSSIKSYVQGLNGLNAGQKNSLTAKLDAASAAASRGDDTAAANQLNAFLNEVNAMQTSGRLTSAQATALRGAVHAVRGGLLGTYNRFLDWWPSWL